METRDLLAVSESIHAETAHTESSRISEPSKTEEAHAGPVTSSAQAEPAGPGENCARPAPASDSADPALVTESPAPALPGLSEPEVSDAAESPASIIDSAAPAPAAPETASPKRPVSERRRAANRANAQKSTGPRTPEGKRRSALNATRHGILSQVLHLPEEEMAAYDEFTCPYVSSLSLVGQTETELARACADLQFRLHRLSAAEHNLFALGHEEHGDRYDTGHPESHAAMTFVETLRCSKDPLATLSLYEQRLSRRFLQTLNKLHQMQKERRALEQEQLKQLYMMSLHHPEPETLDPAEFGFVCSTAEWKMFYKRIQMLTPPPKTPNGNSGYKNRSQSGRSFTRRAA
jgi:hypothetical protein